MTDYVQARGKKLTLTELKKSVENWHEYFKSNNQRFWDYTKFVCATTLTSSARTALAALSKPQLEFNIIEAMVSRLRGEFAKHTPSFEVRAADGVPTSVLTEEFTQTLDIIEGHLRAIFSDTTNDSLKYKFYSDIIVGGFSVGEVLTQYLNSRSFEQTITVERVFDPTLTFFDPLARMSHKGDGRYAGKLVPMTLEDFKEQFGANAAEDINFTVDSNLDGFKWAYKNQAQEVVLVAHMYVKKTDRIKIVKLSNGHVVPKKHYDKLLEAWEEEAVLLVPPKVLDTRWTNIETICCYKFCDTKVLDYQETNFDMLPLVFIDGNSALVRGIDNQTTTGASTGFDDADASGPTIQMTKPYIMHAKDMQLLMNFAGQSLASEMENIVQHQYIAAAESIPEDYEDAYTNPQLASVLVYNQIYDKDTNIQLNPPQILQRRQIPPELSSVFNGAPGLIQTILGTYEASLGINDKQLSGVAIQQGALQSNAAALPYLMGWTNGMSRFAEIILHLIPKYYRTARTLPVIKSDGKRDYQIINQKNDPQSITLDYDPNNLQIKVEMGVSAAIQKQVSMDMINSAMASNPDFASFITTMGLEVYLDNMDIRGIDHLKELSVKYMEQKQAAQEAQSQQPSEVEILAETELKKTEMETEQRREANQAEQANKAADLAIRKQEADMKFLELLAKIESNEQKSAIEREKLDAENARTAVETSMALIDKLTRSV